MTTNNTRDKEVYLGDGTTTVFPVRIFYTSLDNIEAILFLADGTRVPQVRDSDYTLTVANPADPDLGGTLTMLTAPATGTTLLIRLNIPLIQETELPLGGRFPSVAVEQAFDELVQIARQNAERNSRTLSLPESTLTVNPPAVPDPVTGRALVWAADGNLANSTVAPDELVGEAQAAATAAQASATAAAGSATSAAGSVTAAAAQVTLAETARTGAETAETGAEAARDAALAAVGTVRVSSDDTTPGTLEEKIVITGGNLSTLNPGANEQLRIEVTGGGPSLGTNSIMRTNAQTISENITVPTGTNAMTIGEVTIADTFTVTVEVGAEWVVV